MKYLVITFVILYIGFIHLITIKDYPVTVVSKASMEAMCDEDYECYGYATWGVEDGRKTCAIYMLPMSYYPNDGDYEYVLEHEKRHCREGSFH